MPPPTQTITYNINVNIAKIDGIAPTPNMLITGATISIEVVAHGTQTTTTQQDNEPPEVVVDDIPDEFLEVFIKFGSSATLYPALSAGAPIVGLWLLSLPVPLGNANGDGQLLITAIAQPADIPPNAQAHARATHSVTVDVDNEKPRLTIVRPLLDETIVLTGTSVSVPLEVTATDNRQVAEVKWSLNATDYNNAITLDQTGRGIGQVQVVSPGQQTINVRAKDIFNNVAEQSVTIDVAPPFTPVDPADLTGQIAYLSDLLEFAAKRIRVSTNPPDSPAEPTLPSATDFTNIFCQRFNELIDSRNHAVALQSVHQIRVSVDVLRQYLLNRVPQWHNHPQDLTAAEAEYRHQAYDALLRYLGTSERELRRALTGEPATRLALANRLGIETEALQGLLLPPGQVTEETLERIFGLADTHSLRDPFATNATPPDLLVKRRAHVRSTWRQQDDAVRHPALQIPVPVIDPDLVQADDLHSSTALSLWQARQVQVQNLLKALRALPGSNLPKLEAAINLALKAGAIDTLKDLSAKYKTGKNIEPQLHEMFLELLPFLYLMQIYELLAPLPGTPPGSLIDDEWEQVYSILVQAQKLRDAYPTWRAEEIARALTLGPDDFTLQPATAIPLELPLWRATPNARQAWKVRLAARIDQDQSLMQALQAVVDSAEVIALPHLRDRFINLIQQAANPGNDDDTAERLTTELFIDFKSSNDQKISWVGQAIETLQSILFALRMGRLASSPVVGVNSAAGWQLGASITSFDEEWQWMGSYTTWRSAMGVFLFPENFLQPAMRPLPPASPGQTKAFKEQLVEPLRGLLRLTRTMARYQANKTYLGKLKEEIPQASTSLGSFEFQEPTSIDQIEQLRTKITTVFTAVNPNAEKFQDVANWVQEVFYFVPLLLAQQLERSGEYLAALDWYKAIYAFTLPTNRKIYRGLILEENDPNNFARTDDWLLADFNPHKIAQTRANVYTRFTIRSLAQCLLAFADDQFTKETVESIPQARARYLEALELLNLPEMRATSQLGGKNVENSLLQSVRNHASMNLLKLRNGLNIAGLERPLRSDTTIRTVTRRPTPYRYQVLIERAKQLTATAGQIEASFLSVLEKRDAEQYSLFKAQQDIELSRTQEQLQNLRTIEAQDGVQLAALQQERAQIQVDHFQDLIEEGLNNWEIAALTSTVVSGLGGILRGIGTALQAGAANKVAGIGEAISSGAAAAASVSQMQASFERREQEWKLQLSLSRQDVVIGNQQITLAQDCVSIAQQELQIAAIQVEHAMQTINFLANKFTNAELFDWMSRVLERVYAFFLQQATAIARLAETQLAFERQEALPTFIQSDYWQAPDESNFGNSAQGMDRRGLTGSARLLQAITELDQYAFLNDRRKLQLSKTFSLAALSPFEFQRFRETGVMLFGTLREYFDRDFPGHYLRLIRQVRVDVPALIPSIEGIHATLTNRGVSRVTIDDGGFQDVEVHHGPQSVALTAPVNATGVFQLNPQPELLQPFEAIGVDTFWEFCLPKAANPFDFDTIADVLITFDYTALDSWDYRQQVMQRLDPNLRADRVFSFRNQFADQWYDLHNPAQTTTPLVVRFTTERQDFPPHLEDLRLQHLVLYVVRAQGHVFEISNVQLLYTAQGETTPVGGMVESSSEGIISTRRGNAGSWTALIDKAPIGVWELTLPNTEEMRNRFKDEEIDDILLAVTYAGLTPAWPV